MRLNARMIKNVANVNQWEYTSEVFIQEGQPNDIYFQIIDLDKPLSDGFYLRYISQAINLAVEATFPSIDNTKEIIVAATQPFADDKSIWKITLSSLQTPNSGAFKVKITEDGVDRYFSVKAAIQIDLLNTGGC